MTAETYGPALGSTITIDAPRRECHGRQGKVVSLLLATNEAMVELENGTRYMVPWPPSTTLYPHGMMRRYRTGCRCHECAAANARHVRDWRHRQHAK